jgi:hypothetical protein
LLPKLSRDPSVLVQENGSESVRIFFVPKRCKYIGIVKKTLLRGSTQEIYQVVCRAGPETLIGTPAETPILCQNCQIGNRMTGEHCANLEAERIWEGKGSILYLCRLLAKRNFDPDKVCPSCNDFELVR